jgi:hypothetical protein
MDVWTLLSDTADRHNQRDAAKQDSTPVHDTEACMNHSAKGKVLVLYSSFLA